jgi:cystathionine beta-lyase
MNRDTKLIHSGRPLAKEHKIVNVPVYRASTVLFDNVADMDGAYKDKSVRRMTYGRRGTPTLWAVQDCFAELHGAAGAVTCPSGIAAVGIACLSVLKAGDHVLFADTVYGPTRVLAKGVFARAGIEVSYYDPMIGAGIESLIRPNTRAILLESPGSQTFEVQDVPAITAIARARSIHTIIDNTWATPLLFQPLKHGVDIVVESATKFICGHSDSNLGLIAANAGTLAAVQACHGDLGQTAGPDDAYIAQRGFKTLSIRMERHQMAALKIAEWLANREDVTRVLHPALPYAIGHDYWKRDFEGSSSLFGFIVPSSPRSAIAAMVDHLDHFGIGYSYGGYESLALPQDPRPGRTATKWDQPGDLIRLHIGLENVDDLIADLNAGLARLKAARLSAA